MADYSYVIRRIIGHNAVGELAAYNVRYEYALNGYGSFEFTVAMNDNMGDPANPTDPFVHTTPKRFIFCIERNGVLVYAGIIWSRQLDYVTREIHVAGNEWGSIYERQLWLDYDFDKATKLVLDDMLGAAGNLPLPAGGARQGSGGGLENNIQGFFDAASHLKVMAAITQIASSLTDGFEFRWKAEYDVNNRLLLYCVVGSPLGVEVAFPGTPQPGVSAPGGGGGNEAGRMQTWVEDEKDSPNIVYVYTNDGYEVEVINVLYAGTLDDPVNTYDAWTFSTDLFDYQVQQIALARYALLDGANGDNPTLKLSTATIVAPTNLTDFGVEGDYLLPAFLQRRESEFPTPEFRRIIGREVTIDSPSGLETLTLNMAFTTET